MTKIRIIKAVYECPSCGSEIKAERKIIIDEYLGDNIELPNKPCSCGNRGKKRLTDLTMEDTE